MFLKREIKLFLRFLLQFGINSSLLFLLIEISVPSAFITKLSENILIKNKKRSRL
jgi:hypothetical protein